MRQTINTLIIQEGFKPSMDNKLQQNIIKYSNLVSTETHKVNQLIKACYANGGSSEVFAAMLMEYTLLEAEKAIESQSILDLLKSYRDLQDYTNNK